VSFLGQAGDLAASSLNPHAIEFVPSFPGVGNNAAREHTNAFGYGVSLGVQLAGQFVNQAMTRGWPVDNMNRPRGTGDTSAGEAATRGRPAATSQSRSLVAENRSALPREQSIPGQLGEILDFDTAACNFFEKVLKPFKRNSPWRSNEDPTKVLAITGDVRCGELMVSAVSTSGATSMRLYVEAANILLSPPSEHGGQQTMRFVSAKSRPSGPLCWAHHSPNSTGKIVETWTPVWAPSETCTLQI